MKKLVALCTVALIVATGAISVSAQEYEVEKGDSLWEIANNNDLTVNKLIDINNLKTTTIHPKQSINLTDQYTYTVEKGDTLIGISDSKDVSVDELKEWNDLSSDLIVIGEELSIETTEDKSNDEQSQKQEKQKQAEPKQEKTEQKQAEETEKTEAKTASKSTNDQEVNGKTISVKATAYTAKCDGCSGVTYTGVDLNKNRDAKVIAVDPDVIPLGSTVYVEGYGYAEAEDIGGAIQGNRVDLHVSTEQEANNYGVQNINVTIVD